MAEMTYSQANRTMGVLTPLADDELLLVGMTGAEELGRLYTYQVELASTDAEIDLDALLGQPMAVWADNVDGERRFFHGIISSFRFAGIEEQFAHYHATVVPWLWLLTRAADARIFQNMTAPEIILQVFRDHGFRDFADDLSEDYPEREYCVQYHESDFDFVTRLMEEEGIYYYFRHEEDVHTLVLCDGPAAHTDRPGYEQLLWRPAGQAHEADERLTQWQLRKQVRHGAFTHVDYNFKTPTQRLLSTLTMQPDPDHAHSGYERFEDHGRFHEPDDGDRLVRIRMEEAQCRHEVATGVTDARGVAVGHTFTLKDYPRQSLNRPYLTIAARYELTTHAYRSGSAGDATESYTCTFDAIDSQTPFRLERITPRPRISGLQTAEVVGPDGEEIFVDEYGRIKVQFHWDRDGEHDENVSCFIRVAEPWAGRQWGAVFTPRIGQEVTVAFINGDPDRPLVTGSVYNDVQMPPYKLPEHKTRSTIKTLTSPDGGGFNELRFEDKKGEEQIFIHAENDHDLRVKNDSREWVGHDRHLLVKNDQMEKVAGDKHLTVEGNQNEQISQSLSQDIGMNLDQEVGMNHALDAGMAIHLKAGMSVVIEAGVSLTLKAGSNCVVIDPSGVTIKGAMVTVDGNMVRIASGPGSPPGSGGGASVATPATPDDADDDSPGQPS